MIAMSAEQVHECLKDAGCGKRLIEQYEACQCSGRQKDQLQLLGDYRRLLLDRIHAEQKKLDLLDYLVWSVKTNASSQRRESIEKMDGYPAGGDAGNAPDRRICGKLR